MGIPKVIMQTWKTKQVPEKWEVSPKSIQKHMPKWKYVLMTDVDNRKFVEKHFPDFLPYYDGFPHAIQRADAVRYCWLYVNGGLYMDLDYEILKPLDPLFKDGHDLYIIPSSNLETYPTNSIMASQKKNPFWLEVIEHMKKPLPFWCFDKHLTVIMSTGPGAVWSVLRKKQHKYFMMQQEDLSPCSVCDSKCDNLSVSYVRPLEGMSWVNPITHVYVFFLCNWQKLSLLFIFIIILYLFYKNSLL